MEDDFLAAFTWGHKTLAEVQQLWDQLVAADAAAYDADQPAQRTKQVEVSNGPIATMIVSTLLVMCCLRWTASIIAVPVLLQATRCRCVIGSSCLVSSDDQVDLFSASSVVQGSLHEQFTSGLNAINTGVCR